MAWNLICFVYMLIFVCLCAAQYMNYKLNIKIFYAKCAKEYIFGIDVECYFLLYDSLYNDIKKDEADNVSTLIL